MKVRISYTVDVDEESRRGIHQYYGLPGLASRQDIKDWYEAHGHAMNDDLAFMEPEKP